MQATNDPHQDFLTTVQVCREGMEAKRNHHLREADRHMKNADRLRKEADQLDKQAEGLSYALLIMVVAFIVISISVGICKNMIKREQEKFQTEILK